LPLSDILKRGAPSAKIQIYLFRYKTLIEKKILNNLNTCKYNVTAGDWK